MASGCFGLAFLQRLDFSLENFNNFVGEISEFVRLVLNLGLLTQFLESFPAPRTHVRKPTSGWVSGWMFSTTNRTPRERIYFLYVSVELRPALPKEGPVNNIPLSRWRTDYASAVFETDQGRMSVRIAAALAAIEERKQSSPEISAIEQKSLEAAQKGLAALKAERIVEAGVGSTNGSKYRGN
jgi:hypothetical protein